MGKGRRKRRAGGGVVEWDSDCDGRVARGLARCGRMTSSLLFGWMVG
jgi:hypothetical protein